MQAILEQCRQVQPELMQTWETLVNIDSGSGYSLGLRQVGTLVGDFCARQGMQVSTHPVADADSEFHVTAVKAGTGVKSILLLAHMDTVFPEGTAAARPFRTDGEWAYGPGVSDCKGGLTLALYAVKILQALQVCSYRQLTCCFNCDEEISSPHSRTLIQQLARQHDYVLSLEPGGVSDSVIAWRKGVAKLKVTVTGKSSHAGSDPDKGANALLELTQQIQRLATLANKQRQTTVTFTKAIAGDRLNVVPDYAEAWADVRATSSDEFTRIEREARELAAATLTAGTKASVALNVGRPPFAANAGTAMLTDKAEKIYAELGRQLNSSGAGGGSDANLAAAAGAVVLDSLGPVKGGPNHTADEKTRLESVAPRLYLLVRLISDLGSGR